MSALGLDLADSAPTHESPPQGHLTGRRWTVWPDGYVVRVISGAQGDDEDSDEDTDPEEEAKAKRTPQQLSREAAKHRVRARENLQRAEAAEQRADGMTEELTGARVSLAFALEAGSRGVRDIEAAIKLADLSGVTLNEDGDVEGLDAALDGLVDKYPYLSADAAPEAAPTQDTGRPGQLPPGYKKVKKGASSNLSAKQLAKTYPALRGRGPNR